MTNDSLVIHIDDLGLGVEGHHLIADLAAAIATLLDSSEWRVRIAANPWPVHMNDPGIRTLGEAKHPADIASEYRRRQSIAHVVRYPDRFVDLSHSDYRDDRPEDLFLG